MVIKEAPNGMGGKKMLSPKGRGMYIWKLGKLFGGDYYKALEWAIHMKLDWIAVKVLNGKWKYNYWNGKWQVEEFMKVFHGSGIEVHGWQWVLMDDPVNEGKALVSAVNQLGLKGAIMNVEAPCKGVSTAKAVSYSQELTNLSGIPIGFSSYRFPTYHPQILYAAYIDVCTYLAPQIYWQPSHNPVAQLLRSKAEYDDLGYEHKPFIPTGPAYEEWGHKPLKQELVDFNQAVIEEKYPALSWWRFMTSVDEDFANLIAKMPNNYGGVESIQPPPQPPDTRFKCTTHLNIRAAPGSQSEDIGTLASGSDILLVERDGVWGRIDGWVHTDYLEPL